MNDRGNTRDNRSISKECFFSTEQDMGECANMNSLSGDAAGSVSDSTAALVRKHTGEIAVIRDELSMLKKQVPELQKRNDFLEGVTRNICLQFSSIMSRMSDFTSEEQLNMKANFDTIAEELRQTENATGNDTEQAICDHEVVKNENEIEDAMPSVNSDLVTDVSLEAVEGGPHVDEEEVSSAVDIDSVIILSEVNAEDSELPKDCSLKQPDSRQLEKGIVYHLSEKHGESGSKALRINIAPSTETKASSSKSLHKSGFCSSFSNLHTTVPSYKEGQKNNKAGHERTNSLKSLSIPESLEDLEWPDTQKLLEEINDIKEKSCNLHRPSEKNRKCGKKISETCESGNCITDSNKMARGNINVSDKNSVCESVEPTTESVEWPTASECVEVTACASRSESEKVSKNIVNRNNNQACDSNIQLDLVHNICPHQSETSAKDLRHSSVEEISNNFTSEKVREDQSEVNSGILLNISEENAEPIDVEEIKFDYCGGPHGCGIVDSLNLSGKVDETEQASAGNSKTVATAADQAVHVCDENILTKNTVKIITSRKKRRKRQTLNETNMTTGSDNPEQVDLDKNKTIDEDDVTRDIYTTSRICESPSVSDSHELTADAKTCPDACPTACTTACLAACPTVCPTACTSVCPTACPTVDHSAYESSTHLMSAQRSQFSPEAKEFEPTREYGLAQLQLSPEVTTESRGKAKCPKLTSSGMDTKASTSPPAVQGTCIQCGTVTGQRCANCRQVFYCKRECQQQHWKQGHKNECKSYKVEKNSQLGRYLVAARDFKAGDVIMRDVPFFVGPKQISKPVCLGCYKLVDGSYRCRKCTWPLCSPACEAAADHQPECVVGRVMGSPIDIKDFNDTNHFYEVVSTLRGLALKKRSPKKYAELTSLESHSADRLGTHVYHENQKRVVNMLRNYFMLVGFPLEDIDASERAIHQMTDIIDVNAVEIPRPETEIIGVYPNYSMLEHSCTPNTKYRISSSYQLTLKAAVDIRQGEHLSTIYTHMLWGTAARRDYLKNTRYFMCTCRRCADPTELGTNFSALRCQKCPMGFMMSGAPLDQLADWICTSCNNTITADEANDITLHLGEEVEETLSTGSAKAVESMIDRISSSVVHPNHFHLFAARHTLLQMIGREAEGLDEVNVKKKEKLCQEFLKTCTALDPGMSKLSTFAGVALYEYHVAVMARARQGPTDQQVDKVALRRDLDTAKALLQQCIRVLEDEPKEQPEAQLRTLAHQNLQELTQWESSLV